MNTLDKFISVLKLVIVLVVMALGTLAWFSGDRVQSKLDRAQGDLRASVKENRILSDQLRAVAAAKVAAEAKLIEMDLRLQNLAQAKAAREGELARAQQRISNLKTENARDDNERKSLECLDLLVPDVSLHDANGAAAGSTGNGVPGTQGHGSGV